MIRLIGRFTKPEDVRKMAMEVGYITMGFTEDQIRKAVSFEIWDCTDQIGKLYRQFRLFDCTGKLIGGREKG